MISLNGSRCYRKSILLIVCLFVAGVSSIWQENVRPKLYVELGEYIFFPLFIPVTFRVVFLFIKQQTWNVPFDHVSFFCIFRYYRHCKHSFAFSAEGCIWEHLYRPHIIDISLKWKNNTNRIISCLLFPAAFWLLALPAMRLLNGKMKIDKTHRNDISAKK